MYDVRHTSAGAFGRRRALATRLVETVALSFDVFQVVPRPVPSAVPGFEEAVGAATWPPSTSTYIWGDGGGLLVDALIRVEDADQLAQWVAQRGQPLDTIYLTHPHADHFLGLPSLLRAFPNARPVAAADALDAFAGQISPEAMRVWGSFFPAQLPEQPVVPEALTGRTIAIGGETATVVPVGVTDTEHSSVLHVPALGLVAAGDVVYNRTHMWMAGSTPESRESWRRALDTVAALGAATVIAGHRDPDAPDNDAVRQVAESRQYIADFEAALAASRTPDELIERVSARYRDWANPYTLWVSAFNLLGEAP